MKKKLLTILALAFSVLLFAQDSNFVKRDRDVIAADRNIILIDRSIVSYQISDSTINFHTTCFVACDSNLLFLNVHDNENTSVEAVEVFLPSVGGTLMQLKHSGNRLVGFNIKSKTYIVDPNRIFSTAGVKASLLKNNKPHFAPQKTKAAAAKNRAENIAAEKLVKKLAAEILDSFVTNRKLVVALHNNTEGSFSIESYKKGGDEYKATGLLYINPDMDPDDFILTTERKIYDQLKAKSINVVLQSRTAPDDGSLSVYAQKKQIPYVNVEAQAEHFEEQLQMLQALEEIIQEYR